VWASDSHGAEALYERVLPFLIGKPLSVAQSGNADGTVLTTAWRAPPQAGDHSCVHLVMQAAMLLLVRSGLSEADVNAWEALVKARIGAMMLQDLENLKVKTQPDSRSLHRQIMSTASRAGKLQRESHPVAFLLATVSRRLA
jgi:hypothetical protein